MQICFPYRSEKRVVFYFSFNILFYLYIKGLEGFFLVLFLVQIACTLLFLCFLNPDIWKPKENIYFVSLLILVYSFEMLDFNGCELGCKFVFLIDQRKMVFFYFLFNILFYLYIKGLILFCWFRNLVNYYLFLFFCLVDLWVLFYYMFILL